MAEPILGPEEEQQDQQPENKSHDQTQNANGNPPPETQSDDQYEHWSHRYGEEFKGNSILERYKDEKEALKSLDEKHRLLSKKLPEIPSDDSDPEAWDEVFKKLGRPDSPDEYNVNLTTQDENGKEVPMELDDNQMEVVNRLAKVAHESGMNNRQFNTALKKIVEQEQERSQKDFDPMNAEETLKKELKGNYAEFKEIATREWQNAPDDIKELLSDIPNAKRAKILHYLGKSKGEDSTPKDTRSDTGPSLEDIDKEMKQIMNGDHPTYGRSYWVQQDREQHQKARERYQALIQLKNNMMTKGKK